MSNSIVTFSFSLSFVGILLLIEIPSALGQREMRPVPLPLAAWQTDINCFESELRKLVAKARVPERKALERRLKEKPSDLEVTTDGYGGVVDFNAAKGTVQYVANELVEGRPIVWEFELAKDAKQSYDKSINLVPKFTTKPKGEQEKQDVPLLIGIRVKESKAGPFKAGDRIRLNAFIDDFSRFRKKFRLATGLAALYYLEDAPNAVFNLRLDKAEITLIPSQTSTLRDTARQ